MRTELVAKNTIRPKPRSNAEILLVLMLLLLPLYLSPGMDPYSTPRLIGAKILGPRPFEDLLSGSADLDQRVERGPFFHDFSRMCLERHLLTRDEVVLVPPEPLNRVQLFAVRRAHRFEPELIVVSDRVNHQRVALPAAD